MDRSEQIYKKLEPMLEERFAESCQKISDYLESHSEQLVKEFLEALIDVHQRAYELQQSGTKGKIRYVVCSHLYSEMALKTYKIKMDLFDERFYVDPVETTAYWSLAEMYHYYEEDMEVFYKELERSFPRLREIEMDELKYQYSYYYHCAAKQLLSELAEEIYKEHLFSEVEYEPEFQILFGEYMDQADVIFQKKERKENEIF